MDVSENSDTPKSSISIGFSIMNHPFLGYPYFWKRPHISRWFEQFKERVAYLVDIRGRFFNMPLKWSLSGCHGMESFNWFCFEIQLHHFEVESLSPTKTHHSWILPQSLKKKCLKYLSSYHFDSFLSYVLWAPKKTRWWFQIYFFFLIFTRIWGNDTFWRAYFSDGRFNHQLEKTLLTDQPKRSHQLDGSKKRH